MKMKKILIIAAVAMAALASNAAAFSWATSGAGTKGYLYDSSSTKLGTLTAYLFDAGTVSQADLLTGLRDGSAITDFTSVKSTTVSSASKIAATDVTYGTDGNTYNFYMAIVNGEEVLLSDSVSALAQESGTTSIAFANPSTWSKVDNGAASFSSAGWYQTVPEPTSGLLMLVGLGALALRRRRA
jgi:hypothetical protein